MQEAETGSQESLRSDRGDVASSGMEGEAPIPFSEVFIPLVPLPFNY